MSGGVPDRNAAGIIGPALALGALVAAGRLPFLGPGYGLDPDAWRVADAARTIADTGRYAASRPPGYPVHEIVSSLAIDAGPLGLCGLTALLSVVAALALADLVRTRTSLESRRASLAAAAAGIAFAYAPIVAANSVVALDYLWACAFLALSLRAAVRGGSIATGLWLGVAAGCRLTSLLALPTLLLCLAGPTREWRARRGDVLRAGLASAISATLCFAPAIWLRGAKLGTIAETPEGGAQRLLFDAPVAMLGSLGASGLAIVLLLSALRRGDAATTLPAGLGLGRAMLLGIALHALLFARFPFEFGYLIPAVLFGVVLLARVLGPTAFLVASGLIAAAAFVPDPVASLNHGRPVKSVFLLEQEERARVSALLHRAAARVEALPDGSVVVAGWHTPALQFVIGARAPLVQVAYALDAEEIAARLAAREPIYVLPGQASYNRRVEGAALPAGITHPLLPPPPHGE